MNIELVIGLAFLGGVVALVFAYNKSRWILKQEVAGEKLAKIAGYVADGAMAFLSREFRVLIPFVLVVAAFLALANRGFLRWQAMAFVMGALCSGLAGFFGMRVATQSNSRTTTAAQRGLNPALQVAFAGGSVMGMSVVGLALVGMSLVFFIITRFLGESVPELAMVGLPVLSGFSLGASSIALFARVGGGIYTKAADVGADLVGKVEAGIPEDDHRNPATIADNVGDNVGDVAGMGADLFESYVGSLVGAMILGLAAQGDESTRFKLAMLPLLLSALGIACSMAGFYLVRAKPEDSPQRALNMGTFGAAIFTAVLAFPLIHLVLGPDTFNGGAGANGVFFCALLGLAAGLLIGLMTEFYTGTGRGPVNGIAKACETGPATTIITGMGVGMMSTALPVVTIGAAILGAYQLAGLFGIGVAALGMLLTLGIQLSVDAYGPIADNAGGLAEMAEFPPEVRGITDKLDAVGNTTAAIGKGFAIGSAALTAIILFAAFKEAVGIDIIDITEPLVLVGLFLGAVIPYVFSSLAIMAVGRAAFAMIEEVRRQFRTMPGILEEKVEPDYSRCVDISTKAALREMLLPGLLAAITPVAVGFLGGINMLMGMLAGVTVSGVVLAIFMSNAGGAWDNAKKTIESGVGGGKGSEAHKAAVVGDTVGDPLKDTAGPSLNILVKLMAIVSLVIAPMLRLYWG